MTRQNILTQLQLIPAWWKQSTKTAKEMEASLSRIRAVGIKAQFSPWQLAPICASASLVQAKAHEQGWWLAGFTPLIEEDARG